MPPRSNDPAAGVNEPPLCVDLDGTLLATDSFQETLLLFFKQHPWRAWLVFVWLLQGRAHLKQRVAEAVEFDPAHWPVNTAFLEFLQAEHARGRRLILATGSDERVARRTAERFGIFEEVIASDGVTNVTGSRKLKRLAERYGARGFDYAGNSHVDYAVWKESREAVVVNASARVEKQARVVANVSGVFPRTENPLRVWSRLLRVHQWPKNILIIVPAITGHRIFERTIAERLFFGLIAFCLCASSVYLVNDLMDLESDRSHRTKRNRPLAAGRFPLMGGVALAGVCLLAAFLVGWWLSPVLLGFLAIYYLTSSLYSCVLKRVVLLDVFVLAGLYTLRILAGHGASGIGYSNWLLGLSMFLFLSLALLKRYVELRRLGERQLSGPAGRGYQPGDMQVVLLMGIVTGCMAALVLALYINSKEVVELYRSPTLLLFICPVLLYWISRVWLKATRDEVDDDPVVFALRDKISYVLGLLAALFIWVASVW